MRPERRHFNLDLLDLKICAFLTFGSFRNQLSKAEVCNKGQYEHEVIFCNTLLVDSSKDITNYYNNRNELNFWCFPKSLFSFLLPIERSPPSPSVKHFLNFAPCLHPCLSSMLYSNVLESEY